MILYPVNNKTITIALVIHFDRDFCIHECTY
jgi:hypothetical protein